MKISGENRKWKTLVDDISDDSAGIINVIYHRKAHITERRGGGGGSSSSSTYFVEYYLIIPYY